METGGLKRKKHGSRMPELSEAWGRAGPGPGLMIVFKSKSKSNHAPPLHLRPALMHILRDKVKQC